MSTSTNPEHPATPDRPWGSAETPYLEIGGEDRVRELAEAFYDAIDSDSPRLRAMLPASTLNTRKKFFMYLSGWLGGPGLYEARWGHPRLRMRHMPFSIGEEEAAEWMDCMTTALDTVRVQEPLRSFLVERFSQVASHMRNQP